MLHVIRNKIWKQHSTKKLQHGHLPPISQTIQVRRTRHAKNCWRSKDELISDMDVLVMTNQQRLIFISCVQTQDATLEDGLCGRMEEGREEESVRELCVVSETW